MLAFQFEFISSRIAIQSWWHKYMGQSIPHETLKAFFQNILNGKAIILKNILGLWYIKPWTGTKNDNWIEQTTFVIFLAVAKTFEIWSAIMLADISPYRKRTWRPESTERRK